MKRNGLILSFALACLAAAPPACMGETANPHSTTTLQATPARKATPFNGKVVAVDKAAKTVTLGTEKKPRVFHLTTETKITKDGAPGTIDDITVGEKVGGSAVKTDAGTSEVVTLNLGKKPKASKKQEAP